MAGNGYMASIITTSTVIAWADGLGSNAQLSLPIHLALDVRGNIVVADHANHRIRLLSAGGGTVWSAVVFVFFFVWLTS